MSTTIVVCVYKEPIEWLYNLSEKKVLYNKGDNYIDGSIVSENIGREGESFLRYIIDYYDVIDERVFFLQGNPFDHCPDVIDRINDNLFLGGLGSVVSCAGNGSPHHSGLDIDGICSLIGIAQRPSYDFYIGGQFAVNKNQIKRRSLDWWKKCYEVYMENPNSPWIFERIWPLIFNEEV